MSAMSAPLLRSPFPYFGGKSRVASAIWARFGDVPNFVDPFFGSGAVLLARPTSPRTETVNDADGLLCNFFRAVQRDPDGVAYHANRPVNEVDLHAAHLWLLQQRPDVNRMLADPDWFDACAAGRWVWGASLWIGSGWCSGEGPWRLGDGRMVKTSDGASGGVHRKRPHLSHGGRGVASAALAPTDALYAYLRALARRLRRVRVCCGDWSRVVTPAVTVENGLTAVLLDPPYSGAERKSGLYAVDSDSVAADVRPWAIAHGGDPRYRIALCGYEGEHAMPEGWTALHWKAPGGYGARGNGRGRDNAAREVVWFSPHCQTPERRQAGLFDREVAG